MTAVAGQPGAGPRRRRRRRRTTENVERLQKAMALRVAGASWATVATELDWKDAGTASRAVARYQDSLGTETSDQLREIDRQRADWLWSKARQRLYECERRGGSDADWARLMGVLLNCGLFHSRVSGSLAPPPVQVHLTAPDDVRRLRDEFIALRTSEPVVDAEVVEE